MQPENAAAVTNGFAYANSIESSEFLEDRWNNAKSLNMPPELQTVWSQPMSAARPRRNCVTRYGSV